MKALTLVFLALNGLMFIGLGLNGLFNPVAHLGIYGLDTDHAAWLGEIRANYGGMHLAMGLLMASAVWRVDWRRTALVVIALFLAGLGLGRTLSLALDGMPDASFVYVFIAVEWIGAALAVLLLRKLPA